MEIVYTSYDIGEQQKYAKRIFNHEKFDTIHMHLKEKEQISTHHAKTDVLIIVRKGKVEFNIEGKTVTLTKEEVLHMEPYEKHSLRAIEETDLILVKI